MLGGPVKTLDGIYVKLPQKNNKKKTHGLWYLLQVEGLNKERHLFNVLGCVRHGTNSSDSEFFSSDCNSRMTSCLVVLVLVETCGGGQPHGWLGSVSLGAKVLGHVLVGKLWSLFQMQSHLTLSPEPVRGWEVGLSLICFRLEATAGVKGSIPLSVMQNSWRNTQSPPTGTTRQKTWSLIYCPFLTPVILTVCLF